MWLTQRQWHEYGHACSEHVEALMEEIKSLQFFHAPPGPKWPRPNPARVLEVGSWLGTTAIAMADAGAAVVPGLPVVLLAGDELVAVARPEEGRLRPTVVLATP